MIRNLGLAAFVAGLGVVAWVGYGYVGSNMLALAMTLLIALFYLMGAVELHRFRQASASLRSALEALPETVSDLGGWLATLHLSLRNAVRLRIEGERVGLPGPSLTPYLVGLLVLLGMLGTFLGMVVTLNGAVMALESTTDLPTIRAALAAPVRGLGLAFGTSVAGVAASAMLGLVSVLCRRERMQVAQALDARMANSLRPFSLAHQRAQTLEALQAQSQLLPQVVGQMQAMMAQMERHSEALSERLTAGQDRFHQHAQGSYAELALSVDRSLKDSLVESARLAGAAIQPAVEGAMQGITRETARFQEQLSGTVAQQLDGLASRFDTTVSAVADVWAGALARHERSGEALASGLQQSLEGFTETFTERSASLLAAVDARQQASERIARKAMADLAQQASALHEQMAQTSQRQLDGVAERFGVTAATVAQSWHDTLDGQQQSNRNLSASLQASLADLVAGFERQSTAMLATLAQAHATLESTLVRGDEARLAAWTGSLEAMAQSLQAQWQQVGERAQAQQAQICATLAQTSQEMQAQAAQQAQATIGEMSNLIEAASEAPRAAAEVLGALREKLSDSMERDNEMLLERSRIMDTLGSLLGTVNQAANEQRSAIDALIQTSADMLEKAGARFDATMTEESGRMTALAAQVGSSAVEMASLGESFGAAVQLFSSSSESLTAHLQRIEAALGKSTARSDEQLAYYVAQAREIVDLSISSQKQIVEDLQRLAIRQAPQPSAVA
jgi:hypothetical protein